jgi:Protein of unknown function (DUF3152)
MIDNRPAARRRGLWWTAFSSAVVVMLVGGAALGHDWVRASTNPAPAPSASPVPAASPSPLVESASASTSPSPSPSPAPVLALRTAVPTQGTGKFTIAPGRGPVLGRSGPLRTYHVAVEHRSGQDAAEFAQVVDSTLGDSRSWIGGRGLRLQRVDPSVAASFTVFLATRVTAAVLCDRGGTNIRIGGVPYTSCRTTGRAIINLDRWELSAPPYVSAKVPLATYRQYVINHEVGHELGHQHEGCPRNGSLAPVMVQQTLTLRGCVPNAWPRPNGQALSGPPV